MKNDRCGVLSSVNLQFEITLVVCSSTIFSYRAQVRVMSTEHTCMS